MIMNVHIVIGNPWSHHAGKQRQRSRAHFGVTVLNGQIATTASRKTIHSTWKTSRKQMATHATVTYIEVAPSARDRCAVSRKAPATSNVAMNRATAMPVASRP